MDEFSEGDLVAVFGGKLERDSSAADSVSFCKVLIVGQEDLVVENTAYYSTTTHVVPKLICSKMYLDPDVLSSAETMSPDIGDLVVSFSRTIDPPGVDKKTGILCKITYKLGKPDRCELLCGTETTITSWNSIVVLRRE